MAIPFTCPHCGRYTEVDEQYAGQTGPCGECGLEITVPTVLAGKPQRLSHQILRRENAGLIFAFCVVFLVSTSVLGFVVYRFIPDRINSSRAVARHRACQDRLAQLGIALLAYEVDHGELPPPVVLDEQGRPMHSWRVLLLPYLGPDARAIYANYRMDLPWDSGHNLAVCGMTPDVYRCPAEADTMVLTETSYCLVTGPGTCFEDGKPRTVGRATNGDGADQTILVVECHGARIGWTEPRDIDIVQLARGVNSGTPRAVNSAHQDVAYALSAEGDPIQLPNSLSPSQLRALATCEGGEGRIAPDRLRPAIQRHRR